MKAQPVEQKPLRSETACEITVKRRPHAFNAVTPLFGATIIWQKHEFIWISVDTVVVYRFHQHHSAHGTGWLWRCGTAQFRMLAYDIEALHHHCSTDEMKGHWQR